MVATKVLPIELPLSDIAELCQQYQVRELSLFGSALTDAFRAASDLDFLVMFEPETTPSYSRYTGLQHALEELLDRKVDLVPKLHLKPLIRDEVLESSEVVYAAR